MIPEVARQRCQTLEMRRSTRMDELLQKTREDSEVL